ncbi:MAG TPA: condensation domain-containing protein, partial [Gemmatimonadaceae bacterium]|nr:condensation domain-containing protein [Gemmatimonadaceae bacterium]
DSLVAVALVGRLNTMLNATLRVSELFEAPTVEELTARLSRRVTTAPLPPIVRQTCRAAYPLSFGQRTVISPRNDVYPTRFNCPGSFRLGGVMDAGRLEHAFQALIARHEILRSAIDVAGERQVVAASVPFELPVIGCPNAEVEQRRAEFVRPFDVSRAPLLRAELLRVSANEHWLLFDAHHAVTDAVSLALMSRELFALYRDEVTAAPLLHYGDYAAWQQQLVTSGAVAADAECRRAALDGFVWTELPTRTGGGTMQYDRVAVEMACGHRTELTAACERAGVTTITLVLASIAATVGRATGQHDVTLGLRVSHRSDARLERMIGTFAEDAACRIRLSSRAPADIVADTRHALAAVVDHPFHPYDALNEEVQAQRPTPNGELFTIMVNYLPLIGLSCREMCATFVAVPRAATSKYDVNLRLLDGARLRFEAKYRRDRHTPGQIAAWLQDIADTALRFARALQSPHVAAAAALVS